MGRSTKRKQHNQLAPLRPAGGFAAATSWPVFEALLSRDWNRDAAVVTFLVARRSPKDKIAAASFLVDLACLGLKDASVRLYPSSSEYYRDMRERVLSLQPMIAADLDLVTKIIDEGIRCAASLGFRPHAVIEQAKHLLAGAHPERCSIPVPLGGPDGKPLFVAGPYDNVRQIMEHLERKVGAGNFHYLVEVGAETRLLPDHE